jgi:hypothetical protein
VPEKLPGCSDQSALLQAPKRACHDEKIGLLSWLFDPSF